MARSRCKHLLRNFDSPTEPSIGLGRYLHRLTKYLKCTKESYVLALAYLERLTRTVQLEITPLNEHRLILVGVRVASKFLNDVHFDNKYYAEIGGISVTELNFLELAFVYALAFRLYVSDSDYARVRRRLEEGQWRCGGGGRGEEKVEGEEDVSLVIKESKIRGETTPATSRRRSGTDEVEDFLRAHFETLVVEDKAEEQERKVGGETKGKEGADEIPRTPPTPKCSPDAIASVASKGDPLGHDEVSEQKRRLCRHAACEKRSALEADRRVWNACV